MHKKHVYNLDIKLKSIFSENTGKKLDTSNPVVRKYLKMKRKDRLCFAPFKNLYFGIDGSVSSCYAESFVVNYGKYPEKTIEQLWHSDTAGKIRALVKNKHLAPACNLCYTQVLEKNYEVSYANVYDQHNAHNDFPVSMEFYLDNTCNLECIMCSPENSSLIAKQKNIHSHANPYDANFVSELKQYIPYLKHTFFFGGEPFLIPIYYDIWNNIKKINPECQIDITTNGTILNQKVKKALHNGSFNINVSIDSLQKERFEYIRKNAVFENVMENLHHFHDYCKTNHHKFFMSFCPMQQNWDEIPDMLKFANKLNAGLVYNRVWNPSSCAIWSLEPSKLKEIYQYLDGFSFSAGSDIQKFNIEGYNTLKNQVEIWYKTALEFANNYPDITDQIVFDFLDKELKACHHLNKDNLLSEIKTEKQLLTKIKLIHSQIKEGDFSRQERKTFFYNLLMQKSFFINALYFADDVKNVKHIINFAKT